MMSAVHLVATSTADDVVSSVRMLTQKCERRRAAESAHARAIVAALRAGCDPAHCAEVAAATSALAYARQQERLAQEELAYTLTELRAGSGGAIAAADPAPVHERIAEAPRAPAVLPFPGSFLDARSASVVAEEHGGA